MKNLFTLLFIIATTMLFSDVVAQTQVKGNVLDSETGETLIGANISIRGTYIGTLTDEEGNFELTTSKTPPFSLEISYAGYALQEIQVLTGSEQVNVSLNPGLAMEQVTIVGSRVRQRTNLDKAVPVDLIGQKQISHSAQSSVTQIMQYSAPSFHSTPQTISDGTDHIDPAALRGLGPDQTLVLINGKRRHTSSLLNVNGTVGRGTVGTDLNSIPAYAIDRIEVLRDGAAAQYGSDAIAGVVNIILKEKVNYASVDLQTGVSMPNAFGGPDGGDVPSELIPEFNNDGGMYRIAGNFGLGIGKSGGFLNATIEHSDKGATNRSGNYNGSIYPAGYAGAKSEEAFFQQVRDEYDFADRQVMQIGNSAVKNTGIMLNLKLPINDNGTEIYSSAGLNVRDGEARGFYRFPSSQNRVVPQVYPDGFSPQIKSDVLDNSITLGLRTNIGEWKADFSHTYGKNAFDFTISNSINASLGTSSPTEAYAGGFSYGQNTTNVDFSRGFEASFPINVGFGAEFRNENYQIVAGDEASYIAGGVENEWIIDGESTFVGGSAGIQVFPGFQPQNALDENRNNIGFYSEVDFEFTEALLVSVAARYENYSDFGDNLSWKLATRYKLNDQYNIRGSVSTGFRAPSLHQIYFNNLSTQFITDANGDQVPVQVGTFNNDSEVTKGFGIEGLKPETSTNVSFGLTGRVNDNLAFTVDGYLIDIDDRIVLSGRFSPSEELAGGVLAGDILNPLGAGAAQFFTNAVSTKTKGIDVVGSYRANVPKGNLSFTLAGNFTETKVDKENGLPVINTSDLLKGKEDVVFNREEVSRIEVAQPKSKVSVSALYELGNFSALLRATRFGEITYIHPSDGVPSDQFSTNSFTGQKESRDQVFAPKVVPDIEFAYKFTENIQWTLGVHNFTNIYPDAHQHSSNNSSGRFLFSRRVQQFGVRGMFMYTKVGLTF